MITRSSVVIIVMALAGCVGSISEPPGGTDGIDPRTDPVTCAYCTGENGMLRLTRVEYERTLRGVFPDGILDGLRTDHLPSDGRAGPFASNAFFDADIDGVEAYRAVAEGAGELVAAQYEAVLGCSGPAPSGDCVDGFIRRLGTSLYRRPLTADETTAYQTLYDATAMRGGPADGVRLVVTAMLQSPHFLYRIEIGTPTDEPDVFELTQLELASRLSFFLWKSGPDDALMAAAQAGELATPEQIAAQAARMLDDPRADLAISRFHAEWLGVAELETLSIDGTEYPEFEALRLDMIAETERFALSVFRDGDARLQTLLTSNESFVSPELAAFYGFTGTVPPDGRVELDPTQRAGILTHAGFLTAHTSDPKTAAVHIGRAVREHFLCQTLPNPPPVDTIIAPDPTQSTRQQLEAKTSPAACVGCHRLMNPVGFTFGHYDRIGAYQPMDGAHPIDATGDIVDSDFSGVVDGAIELSAALASSAQVEACVARQWLRFALGRTDHALDQRSIDAALEPYRAANGDLRELIVAITATDSFRYRRAPAPE